MKTATYLPDVPVEVLRGVRRRVVTQGLFKIRAEQHSRMTPNGEF